jgi:CubicO group peptidase (beta-lactamase class C family)
VCNNVINPTLLKEQITMKKALILLCLGCYSCSQPKKNGTSEELKYDSVLGEVDKYLTSRIDSGFSGVALIADRNGIIFHKAYSGKGDSIDTNTAYSIASQAKSLTGLAIMQLHERGKLSVGDSITKYFSNVPPDKKDITVRHLLTHTSGLSYCQCTDGETDEQKMIRGILSYPLENMVGAKWSYQNENYFLLASIVEKVSKMTFRNYVQQYILDAAGMNHTGQSGQEKEKSVSMAPIALAAYRDQPVYDKSYKNGQLKTDLVTHRFGAYFSTAEDMYRLTLALKENKLISAATLEVSLQPQTSGFVRTGLYWGYGWVYTIKNGKRINMLNSGREDWMMNSRMYMLENGITFIVWSRDTIGPDKEAAASLIALKLLEMLENY